MKKTIFISVPYGMCARNVLRSEAFDILTKHFRIVILSPLCKDRNFVKEFSREQIVIRDLPKKFNIFFKIYRALLDIGEGYYFTRKTKIATLVILEKCLKEQKPFTYLFRKFVGTLLTVNFHFLYLLGKFQIRLLNTDYYENLIKEFSPSLVFITHPLAIDEFPLAFFAKRLSIPVVAIIHSWDNITAKSGMRTVTSTKAGRMLPIKFDKVIVWNKLIQQELIDYYDYPSSDVFVSGILQFDFYFTNGINRNGAFFKSVGIDPEKSLILYAAGSPHILPKQEDVLEILVKMLDENKFVKPCQLFIRAHPGTNMEEFKNKYKNNKNILFEQPSIANAAMRCSEGWKNDDIDKMHLAQLLYHCSVVINVCSTMSLDSAVFDKPIVCIGFDGYKDNPYFQSIIKHYDFTHYKHIMRTGGVKLAKTPHELLSYVNEYLKNPKIDAEGRRKIREIQCQYVDGKSGQRIGNFISQLMGDIN